MQVDILNNSISNLNSGVSQINKFIVDNNIVGTSAGVGIGLAAKDAIQSLVNDVLLPSFVAVFRNLNMDGVTQFLPVGNKAELNFISFIKQMITFILVVMVSFLFVKLAFDYLLGVETTKKDDKPKNGINNNTIKQDTDTDTKENFTSFYSF
jgi:large-conductance mechanosensitive channel